MSGTLRTPSACLHIVLSAVFHACAIGRLMHGAGLGDIRVDILESDRGPQEPAFYRVWVGPIGSTADREELSRVFEQGQIGKPIAVQLTR